MINYYDLITFFNTYARKVVIVSEFSELVSKLPFVVDAFYFISTKVANDQHTVIYKVTLVPNDKRSAHRS